MRRFMAALKDLFTAREFLKKMLKLGIPIALSGILSSSLQIVDTLMMARLGDSAVAAVGLASRLTFFLSFMVIAVSSGATIFSAQFWGDNQNKEGLRRTFTLSLMLMVPIDLIFSAIAFFCPQVVMHIFSKDPLVIEEGCIYLRTLAPAFVFQGLTAVMSTMLKSTERPRLPLAASIIAISLNIVLNYILIFGKLGMPAMGAKGAALATVIAAVLEAVLLTVLSFVRRAAITPSPTNLRLPDFAFLKKYLATIFPVFLNEAVWSLGVLITTWVYSTMGTASAAAASIYETVKAFIIIICISIGTSGGILVGIELGAGKLDEAEQTVRRILYLGLVAAIVACPILLALIPQLLKLYNQLSPEAIGSLRVMLSVLAILLWIKMGNYNMIVAVMRAGGDTMSGTICDVGSMWAVTVPLIFIFGYLVKWPIEYVFPLSFLGDAANSVFCILCVCKRRWKKRLS